MSVEERQVGIRSVNSRIGIDALKDIQEALAGEVATLGRAPAQFGHFHRIHVAWLKSAPSDLYEGVR